MTGVGKLKEGITLGTRLHHILHGHVNTNKNVVKRFRCTTHVGLLHPHREHTCNTLVTGATATKRMQAGLSDPVEATKICDNRDSRSINNKRPATEASEALAQWRVQDALSVVERADLSNRGGMGINQRLVHCVRRHAVRGDEAVLSMLLVPEKIDV